MSQMHQRYVDLVNFNLKVSYGEPSWLDRRNEMGTPEGIAEQMMQYFLDEADFLYTHGHRERARIRAYLALLKARVCEVISFDQMPRVSVLRQVYYALIHGENTLRDELTAVFEFTRADWETVYTDFTLDREVWKHNLPIAENWPCIVRHFLDLGLPDLDHDLRFLSGLAQSLGSYFNEETAAKLLERMQFCVDRFFLEVGLTAVHDGGATREGFGYMLAYLDSLVVTLPPVRQ